MATIVVGAALLATASRPGSAAPADFCSEYATAAINQVHAALANPGCARSARGPRWIENETIHYRWCLTQSVPMVASERAARTAFLGACRS